MGRKGYNKFLYIFIAIAFAVSILYIEYDKLLLLLKI